MGLDGAGEILKGQIIGAKLKCWNFALRVTGRIVSGLYLVYHDQTD